MTVSERIFYLLEKQGKRQADLVRALNTRPNTVSDWKAKRRNPDVSHLENIANFFGVSIDFLVTGKVYSIADIELTQQHIELMLFIKRAGYVAASDIPSDLLGDFYPMDERGSAVDYLLNKGFIKGVAWADVPADKRKENNEHYRIAERGLAYIENHGGDTVINNRGIICNRNQNSTVTINGDGASSLSEFESELLRIYNALDTESKAALVMRAYELSRKGAQ